MSGWDCPGRSPTQRSSNAAPGDLAVRLTLDDGTCHKFGGRDYYDPPRPFADAADVFFFLVTPNTPPGGHGPAVTAADPDWEAKI